MDVFESAEWPSARPALNTVRWARSLLRGSYQRRQIAHIDRACAVCDLGTVPTDQALTLLEQRRERALELSGIERATTAVVLLGELSECPGVANASPELTV